MCGITGILHLNEEPADAGLLRRMTSVLSHRGPDDEGFFVDNGLGMGFRRLSIIDLSGGRQPMSNEDQTVTVIFNGEIYNFQELRSHLRQQGHTFRTSSDTEVIVHGFEAWGEEVVDHLNGMFAFAVWDSRRRKLLLARDRLGIKPLFYTRKSDTFAFASEIKSLLLLPGFDAAVNQQSVFEYFSHHFIPGSGTIYQQVHKLKPGEILTVTDRQVKTRKYWRPTVTPTPGRTLEDWCQGATFGVIRGRVIWGRCAYAIGSQPLFAIARGLYRMAEYPWLIGGLGFIWGFFGSYFEPNLQRLSDPDLIRFLRHEQLYRLVHGNCLPPREH